MLALCVFFYTKYKASIMNTAIRPNQSVLLLNVAFITEHSSEEGPMVASTPVAEQAPFFGVLFFFFFSQLW